eukprot:m.96353 g.96353  ORF g.96353 m.96353 type:complete len:394 (+) comp8788_c0_seq1:97-1278(+)
MAEAAPSEEAPRILSREEVAALSDDEFFEAYRAGRIARREDRLTEENWEEELEKMPIFMTKTPTPEEVAANPHLAALHDLIQDSTPHELAVYAKTHGNAAMAKAKAATAKKLRDSEYHNAIDRYTEGIELGDKLEDKELLSVLFSNRAAVNLQLGNNRKVILDCMDAISTNSKNIKAYYRAAQACAKLKRFAEAIQWCDDGLVVEPTNAALSQLRTATVKDQSAAQKLQRKREREIRKQEKAEKKLSDAIKLRNITLDGPIEETPTGAIVHFDENDLLVWPVIFLYPEFQQTDFIADFHEGTSFMDHFNVMFPEEGPYAEWDTEHAYRASKLAIYYEIETGALHNFQVKVDPSTMLLDVLRQDKFVVKSGTPNFHIVVAGSPFEKRYLERAAT